MSAVPDPQSDELEPELASVLPLDAEKDNSRLAACLMVGEQLRAWREERRLGLKDVAPVIRASPSKISRLERGESPPKSRDVLDLARYYRVSPNEMWLMERLLEQTQDCEWYEHFSDVTPGYLKRLIALEDAAKEICVYEHLVVPGLLQTRDYARILVRAAKAKATAEDIERVVELRMRRQRILGKPGLTASVLLDESILYRPRGGREVMRAQLEHLVQAIDAKKVRLHIIEFVRGATVTPPYAITHLTFGTGRQSEIAYYEHITGAQYVTRKSQLDEYRNVLSELRGAAESPKDSRAMLLDTIDRLYS